MEKRNYRLLPALIIVSIITVSTAFAATITIDPSQGTISQGTTTEFKLVLDSAPDGIAGYNLNIALSNPAIAEITGVTYPSWESLNNTTYVSDGQVRMSGVDIGKMVQPGATEILLGTVTVRGTSQGVTGFSINSIRLDADGGGTVIPVVNDAQLIVQGGGTITPTPTKSGGTYSGGGGGGSYSGYSSTVSGATVTSTPISTQMVQSPVITPVSTQNVVTKMVTQEVPVQTSTPLKVASPVSTESIPNANNIPFPWIILVEIIIVIGLIGGVIIFYFVRKGL
jgi:hypothetical protein